ncbi:MAG TPA: amidase [Stellaceae bacterium]|nr:amidase [Stellaceae bacterium]
MPDLARLSAREAAQRIAAGSLTSEALVRSCLERIGEREAVVGAWEHLVPEQALAEARARDREPRRGALHGVPIGVKDIMDTADLPTHYGSRAYAGHRPGADAACVALARRAGAVVLGKTVSTEFAAMSPGKTRNPHDPARTPGGSSSGSAAAVADHMVPLAFGTQTAGSIVRPASFCGVVGYKPSFGIVAIAGTKTLAHSLDTIGGLARDVRDVALFIAALTDRPALVPDDLPAEPRLGLYRTPPFDQAEPATLAALEQAASRLSRAGIAVTERGAFAAFGELVAVQDTVMLYESARNLAWEYQNRAAAITLATQQMLENGFDIAGAAYEAARAKAATARARIAEFFGDLDAVLVPAARGEAPVGTATGDPVFNRAWTLLHLPCVTLPGARGPAGMPVGVQIVGRPGEDARLLAVACRIEAALGSGNSS